MVSPITYILIIIPILLYITIFNSKPVDFVGLREIKTRRELFSVYNVSQTQLGINVQIRNDRADRLIQGYDPLLTHSISKSVKSFFLKLYFFVAGDPYKNLDEKTMCNGELNKTEQELFDNFYKNYTLNSHPYIAVIGLTLVVTENEERNFIQEYVIKSLCIIEKYTRIKFVIFTNDEKQIKQCKDYNITYSTTYSVNKFDVPILKSIIQNLEFHYNSWFYGYMNCDILLSMNIEQVLESILQGIQSQIVKRETIIVLTRSNVIDTFFYNRTFNNDNEYMNILIRSYHQSKYANPNAIDVFLGTKYTFTNSIFEDIVIGRYFIDGYILEYSLFREKSIDLIDITSSVYAIHIFGNESYKEKQINEDLLYNAMYFYSEEQAYGNYILFANLQVSQKHNHYSIEPTSTPSYIQYIKQNSLSYRCKYQYLKNHS
ncbi:hypothetical protein WA158_004240 [Blastocystis sp. Blastoise]